MTVPSVVCDASMALAWLKEEPAPAWVARLWIAVRDGRVEIHVPSLFWLEVGNVLVRRADLGDEQVLEGVIRLENLGFLTIEIDPPLRWRAIELARRFGLTTYDALYLALADASDAQLATLDARLRAAASATGCRYGDDERIAAGEAGAAYGTRRAPDRVSLATLGTQLAELRRTVTAGG